MERTGEAYLPHSLFHSSLCYILEGLTGHFIDTVYLKFQLSWSYSSDIIKRKARFLQCCLSSLTLY